MTIQLNLTDNGMTVTPIQIKSCIPHGLNESYPYWGTIFCVANSSYQNLTGVNAAVSIGITPCYNTTENKNSCATQDVINDVIRRSVFYWFYPTYTIDVTNFDNPYRMLWYYNAYSSLIAYGKYFQTFLMFLRFYLRRIN